MKVLFIVFILFFYTSLFAQYDVQGLLRTGVKDIVENRNESAIKRFNLIISVKQDSWEAYFLRGVAKFYLGDYYGSRQDLNKGIEINPYYSELYLFRGASYQLVSDYSKAVSNYKKCIELDPANPSSYVNYGVILMIKEKYNEAIEQYNLALNVNSSYHDANLYRALCYVELKKYEEAQADFAVALKHNKFEHRIFIWRGKMYIDMEDYKAAYEEFDHAAKLDSDNPLIFYYRGVVSYELENFDAALADFDKVLELDPLNALVYYNRAILQSEIGLQSKAIEDYNSAIELNPKNILSYYNLGIIYLEQEQYTLAKECFTNAIKIYDRFYYAYLARSEASYKMGRQKEALADQLTAKTIKEKNADKMYSDSASFSKVVAFDADFVKKSEKDLFVSRRLLKENSEIQIADDYILAYKCDTLTGDEYYSGFLDLFNKTYGTDVKYSFMNVMCVDSSKLEHVKDQTLLDKFNSGINTALQDNFNTSIDYYNSIIQQDPKFVAAYFNRAWVRNSVVNMLKSFDDFPSEVSLSSKTLQNKTSTHTTNRKIYHDYYAVIEDYTKVIEMEPDLFYAWYNRANTKMKLFKYSAALEDYNKALDLNKEFCDAYFNRAIAFLYLADTINACRDFGKAGELGNSEVYPLVRKLCK